jgi:hypothetical protein
MAKADHAGVDYGCRQGPDGDDWSYVKSMVRRLIFLGEQKLYHAVLDYLWLPAFQACELGAVTLRLLHLFMTTSGNLFLEYFPFMFELSVLRRYPWSAIARSGWGATIFALLHAFSKDVCAGAASRRGGGGVYVMPGVLSDHKCDGPLENIEDLHPHAC